MPVDTTMINPLVRDINLSFTAMNKMPNIRYREAPFNCLCLLMQLTFQPWSPTHHIGHLILRTNDTRISNFVHNTLWPTEVQINQGKDGEPSNHEDMTSLEWFVPSCHHCHSWGWWW